MGFEKKCSTRNKEGYLKLINMINQNAITIINVCGNVIKKI